MLEQLESVAVREREAKEAREAEERAEALEAWRARRREQLEKLIEVRYPGDRREEGHGSVCSPQILSRVFFALRAYNSHMLPVYPVLRYGSLRASAAPESSSRGMGNITRQDVDSERLQLQVCMNRRSHQYRTICSSFHCCLSDLCC